MERTLEDLVWKRAGGRCEYCQLSWDTIDLPFEVDHIIAEHHLGRTQARATLGPSTFHGYQSVDGPSAHPPPYLDMRPEDIALLVLCLLIEEELRRRLAAFQHDRAANRVEDRLG